MADPDVTPPLNREQRRARKFHRRGTARQDNLQTQRQNTSGFLSTPPPSLAEEAPSPRGQPADGGAGTDGVADSEAQVEPDEEEQVGGQTHG